MTEPSTSQPCAIVKHRLLQYARLMRLDKPIGTLLLLWPTLWAVFAASHGKPSLKILSIFIFGTFIMRSAGCVINDWTDRDIDGLVTRTKERPLAVQAIKSWEALLLFLLLISIALLLVLQLNRFTFYLACVGVGLTVLYPWMKRVIQGPQLILGFAFAWGIPMAYAAQLNSIPAEAWLLFCACLLWVIVYDTIYALADKPDDITAGVHSTAIWFGSAVLPILLALQVIILVLLLLFNQFAQYSTVFYLGIAIAAVFFSYQQYRLYQAKQLSDFFYIFKQSHRFGILVLATIIISVSL